MTNFQKIIKELITIEGGQEELALKLGIKSPNYISMFSNGKRPISKNVAQALEKVYGYNADELLKTSQLEKLSLKTVNNPFQPLEPQPNPLPDPMQQLAKVMEKQVNYKKTNITAIPTENYMMVEYQDLATAAGVMGGETIDALPETKTRLVPAEYEKGKYLVVRVDGDSMDDGSKYSIPNGSEILIKEYTLNNSDMLPIRNNLFVIVSRDGVVFKQITKHVPGSYITLHSYNDNYEDYNVDMEDVLQIFIYRKIVSNRPEVKPI